MGSALGLDGCAAGWFAVCLDARGRFLDAGVFERAGAAVEAFRPAVVAVDMPVGLTDDGMRDADAAARRFLTGAASSVFNAPPRAVVTAWRERRVVTHAEASALSLSLAGKGISQQTWRLVPKIEEIDTLAGAVEVLEAHPEVSFRVLSGGARLPAKRSWNGLLRRRRLLADAGVDVPAEVRGGAVAGADDVLDAAVVAWTAAGVAAGAPMQAYPAEPAQRDGDRPIVIWARARPP